MTTVRLREHRTATLLADEEINLYQSGATQRCALTARLRDQLDSHLRVGMRKSLRNICGASSKSGLCGGAINDPSGGVGRGYRLLPISQQLLCAIDSIFE